MKRMPSLTGLIIGVTFIAAASVATSSADSPTFNKDIAPILFKNCAGCHRPGEVGPMALLSYKQVRPWAKSIREVILARTMPPWGADPQHGKFVNDRSLSQHEIDTLVAWIDSGAREGEGHELPKLPEFVEGWNIGQPDKIFSMEAEFSVPAEGVVPYQRFSVPTNFGEDKYVAAAEVRVGNRAVVHHAVVFIEDPGRNKSNIEAAHAQEHRLAGYAPGQQPLVMRPGVARLVKKGSVLVFDMHYTPNGEPAKDRTSVGIVFARGPVEKRLGTLIVGTRNFEIPPGVANHEVKATYMVKEDIHIESLGPHMHSRGKDFLYRLIYPDGTTKLLLSVPRYDFNWQTTYRLEEPIAVPRGSKLECVAHYDNSSRNKFNPDPTQSVRFGWQTWDEMLAGYVNYTVDAQNLVRHDSARLK